MAMVRGDRHHSDDDEDAPGEPGAPAPRNAADLAHQEALSAADQTSADSDQTSADADQTSSDSDQADSERDQVGSDADRTASERDQRAADRDRGGGNGDSNSARENAYSKSRADRSKGADERAESTRARALTSLDRKDTAWERDDAASFRDVVAKARDNAAAARDHAAEEHEQALGEGPGAVEAIRLSAAADRRRAAEDRERAARDRQDAARDRARALAELESAHLDELTGFLRRGMGEVALEQEIERARRDDGRLVLVYLDVNGLKGVNDRDGHAAGDALLRNLAAALRANLRSYGPVVRVGGDEFVCALIGTDVGSARQRFAEICAELEERHGASFSVGFAELEEGDSLEDLMQRGDAALLASDRGH